MAWNTSAKIKSPKRTRRDLWVGFTPYGIDATKPNHDAASGVSDDNALVTVEAASR